MFTEKQQRILQTLGYRLFQPLAMHTQEAPQTILDNTAFWLGALGKNVLRYSDKQNFQAIDLQNFTSRLQLKRAIWQKIRAQRKQQ